MNREIITGLHFYQPPRKVSHRNLNHLNTDPLGVDWTKKINQECYQPLAGKQVFDKISYTYYGILREQLDRLDDITSTLIKKTLRKNGVGDPFIHPILPDLSDDDKRILIGAGIKSLGFTPKYFWAPESALDNKTLEILLEFGYQGVICNPRQIETSHEGLVDNKPSKLMLPSRATILAIPFNQRLSNALAFGDKSNSNVFTKELVIPLINRFDPDNILLGWTDGETFGHHWKFGDFFLDYFLKKALPNHGITPVSLNEVEIRNTIPGFLRERTSWSCPHGNLIRWQGACLCCSGNLTWKAGFYETHKRLNENITKLVKNEFDLKKPDYLEVMIRSFDKHFKNPGGIHTKPTLSLISAKVSALTTRTSCGTFFDNPHTSGNINLLFAHQAFEHLRDAGFTKQATQIKDEYKKSLAAIPDPINPRKTILDMFYALLNQ